MPDQSMREADNSNIELLESMQAQFQGAHHIPHGDSSESKDSRQVKHDEEAHPIVASAAEIPPVLDT